MPIIRIEGPADSRLAPYFNLRSGSHTPDSFIVESARLVERLLQSKFQTRSILTTESKLDQIAPLVPVGIPVYVGTKAELKEIVGFDLHRGCLAHASAPSTELSPILKQGLGPVTVVLEGLADPANVGAIIRNAAAFGADLVIADIKGASPFTRKAARTSAGHLFSVPVALAHPSEAIEAIREHCATAEVIVTTGQPGAEALEDIKPGGQKVIIFGNEGTGVSPTLRQLADSCRRVNLKQGVDSLNAAAASALVLYIVRNTVVLDR